MILPRRLCRLNALPLYDAGLTMTAIGICVLIALQAGPDMGWDLRNYHYYGGYRLLHGGGARDFFPAQAQSWLNPTLDAFQVFLIEHLSPRWVVGLTAALQGSNAAILLLVLTQAGHPAFEKMTRGARRFIRACGLTIGLSGPMFISELGAQFGDALVSLFMLAPLALLGWIYKRQAPSVLWLSVAGGLAGAGCGLKLTQLIYAPGFMLCVWFIGGTGKQRCKNLALFILAAGAGLAVTEGWWGYVLWATRGNPVFPAMNGLVHSPDAAASNHLLDNRFAPRRLAQALWFPFATALGAAPGAEVPFRDPRFALSFVLLPLYIVKKPRGWLCAVLAFFYLSYALWMLLFGIERYAVGLELLSGAVILLPLLGALGRNAPVAAGAMTLAIYFATTVPDWGARMRWDQVDTGGHWFNVRVPPALTRSRQMFLMLGDEPTSYIAPFFPVDAAFVRLQGNFEPLPGAPLALARWRAVAARQGPVWSVGVAMPTADQQQVLARYNLVWRDPACISLPTGVDYLVICPLQRAF